MVVPSQSASLLKKRQCLIFKISIQKGDLMQMKIGLLAAFLIIFSSAWVKPCSLYFPIADSMAPKNLENIATTSVVVESGMFVPTSFRFPLANEPPRFMSENQPLDQPWIEKQSFTKFSQSIFQGNKEEISLLGATSVPRLASSWFPNGRTGIDLISAIPRNWVLQDVNRVAVLPPYAPRLPTYR